MSQFSENILTCPLFSTMMNQSSGRALVNTFLISIHINLIGSGDSILTCPLSNVLPIVELLMNSFNRWSNELEIECKNIEPGRPVAWIERIIWFRLYLFVCNHLHFLPSATNHRLEGSSCTILQKVY